MTMLIYQREGFVDGWSFNIALLAIAHLDHTQSSQLQVRYVSWFFFNHLSFSEVHLIIVWAMLVASKSVESAHSVLQAKHKSLKTQVSLT